MAARFVTWLAIALGGTGGTLAALASSGSAPAASPEGLPLRPLSAIASESRSATPTAAAPAPTPPATTTPPSAAPASADGASPSAVSSAALSPDTNSAPAVPAASSAARPPAPPPAADLLPLPTTKEKLLRQELHCDQRKAESCIVAARSYETGSTGVTDLEKAAKYRRIALTAWISQCDHNSSLACATLASMYRAGSGVPQSDRNADALFARTRELCRFNDAPICHELPSP